MKWQTLHQDKQSSVFAGRSKVNHLWSRNRLTSPLRLITHRISDGDGADLELDGFDLDIWTGTT